MGSRVRFLSICILSAIICIAGIFSKGEGAAILLDKVVAVINSEVITWSDLYKAMEFEASQTVKSMSEQERRKIFKQNEMMFLENLIDMRLLLQEARKANIAASDDEVKKTMDSIRDKYGMTDEVLKDALAKEGFSLAEYKKKLAEQIVISRLVDLEVRSKIVIKDDEMDAYLAKNTGAAAVEEGYKISHILIRNGDDPRQAEEKANGIYEKIKAGESFAEAARKYSEDPSAKSGGDLGFVNKSDLSREFLGALSTLKPGEVSAPFKSDRGVNIVFLESARLFNSPVELKQALRDKLYAEKFDRDYKAWIKGLRQKSYVEIK